MRKMPGLEAAVRAKSTSIEGMSWVREDGSSYGTIRSSGDPDQQTLLSEYEIFRGDLSHILFDMTKHSPNIKYVFGEQIASIQHGEDGDGRVKVEFANSLPTAEFDLVVACDGATSRTRATGLNCGVRDNMHPTCCWAAYFSIKEDLLKGSKISTGFSAPGGRFLTLHPDPAGVTRVLIMSVQSQTDPESTTQFYEASQKGDDALKDFIARRYRGGGWRFDEVMDRMFESDDFYASEMAQVKLDTWHKGRFVLVGDAGYAPGPTGGGTSLALAGAYVLAGELSKHKGDLYGGLKGYEQTMRPIVDDLQKIPPFVFTILAPQTAWGIWLRNHIFAFVAWTRILDFVQRFFASSFGSSEKHRLPEYEWEK
jgi:2-polyprenyl-6-methoxyphenol hydroxylase-like FAD-dependent oxidoreductase